MKSNLAFFLIGMLFVVIGCFLFIQLDSKIPGRIFLVVGVIIEIMAGYKFFINKVTGKGVN